MANQIAHIGCISVKIGQASLELLEQLTIPEDDRTQILTDLIHKLGLKSMIYLTTCNRVEFVTVIPEGVEIRNLRNRVLDFFLNQKPDARKIECEPKSFRLYTGRDAIRHLFEVASSLDSVVVGEAQILGQVKEAYHFSQTNGLSCGILDRLMSAAFKAAKAVRSNTDLGKKPISMASLVARQIDEILAQSPDCSLAIIGSGPMTPKMAQIIRKKYDNRLVFVNRTISKVAQIAERFEGTAVSLEDFLKGNYKADIIISATSSKDPIFTRANIQQLIPESQELFCFDLAIPRDFSSEISEIDGICTWDIEQLNQISNKNRRERFIIVDTAGRIVEQHVRDHVKKEIAKMLSPLFFRTASETSELAENGLENMFNGKLAHLEQKDRDQLRYWSRKLVSRASFIPARQLADQIVEANLENDLELSSLIEDRRQKAVG
jgi:glutamyl-tRNA reductase